MEFSTETFHITENINLTADVAYFQGNPICKTKTIVLEYKGETFRAVDYGTTFNKLLIRNVLDPIYTVELINYLSRLCNKCNMFEIYNEEITTAKSKDLELYTFGKMEDIVQPRARLNQNINDFDGYLSHHYNLCYDSERRKFNKNQLVEHMNSKFTYVNKDFNFNYIPIYGYVNASGKASKTAEPYMHLAVVFNILAHQDRFALINNQEAVASFNVIMKAKQKNTTAVEINENEYNNMRKELEKLKKYKNKVDKRLHDLRHKHVDVLKRLDDAIEKLDAANDKLDNQTKQLQEANDKLTDMRSDIKTLVEDQIEVKEALRTTNIKFKKQMDLYLPSTAITTATTKERLFVFFSKELNQSLRKQIHLKHSIDAEYPDIEKDELILDTICCQSEDLEKRLQLHKYKINDKVIFNGEINNSLDLFKYFNKYIPSTVARVISTVEAKRKIIVKYTCGKLLQQYLNSYALRNTRINQGLKDTIELNLQLINNHIDERIDAFEEKYSMDIKDIKSTVDEIKTSLIDLLYSKHPGCKQMQYLRLYRNIENEDGKLFIKYGNGNSKKYYITEDDISNLRFR